MLQVGSRGRFGGTALAGVVALTVFAPVASGSGLTPSKARAIRDYWTPQRMRAATPLRLGPTAASSAKGSLHHRIRHIKRRPLRAHGKVFFRVTSALMTYDYECSGTAAKAPSKSLVITAGHCSYDQATLSSNGNAVRKWVFVPAYSHGHAPFGKWPGTTTATTQWQQSSPTISPLGGITGGDLRFDVGAGTVGRLHGKTLQSVVGGRSPGFNLSRHRTYHAIGYPAEPPFDGATEFGCDSTFKTSDNGEGGQPAPIGINCDMTGGSSGGGWVDDKGRLVSVTSYTLNGDDKTLYGPYFGSAIQAFYNSVKSG
jgi:V8-like Glu-specific endopeptidase